MLKAFTQGIVLQPPSIANSTNASRVPEVGGGPIISILTAGKDGLISFQYVYGFDIVSPSTSVGISFAKDINISFNVKSKFSASFEFAITIPS